MLCGVLTVAVLAGGVVLVNNYTKMKQMEGVLASVLPAGVENWNEYQSKVTNDDFIIEEIRGHIRPTEAERTEETENGSAEAADRTQNGQTQGTLADVTGESSSIHSPQDTVAETKETSPGETTAQPQPIIGMDKEAGQGDSAENPPEPVDYEAAAANGYRIYTVNAGETLYGICWSHYSSLSHLEEICRINHLTNVDRILAGQKLILP